MKRICIINIPVYDEHDRTVPKSVREAAEKNPDIISISYYKDTCRCIVLVQSKEVAEIISKHIGALNKWRVVSDEVQDYWRAWENATTFEVSDSFEVGVERKLEETAEFTLQTLWDTSREGSR